MHIVDDYLRTLCSQLCHRPIAFNHRFTLAFNSSLIENKLLSTCLVLPLRVFRASHTHIVWIQKCSCSKIEMRRQWINGVEVAGAVNERIHFTCGWCAQRIFATWITSEAYKERIYITYFSELPESFAQANKLPIWPNSFQVVQPISRLNSSFCEILHFLFILSHRRQSNQSAQTNCVAQIHYTVHKCDLDLAQPFRILFSVACNSHFRSLINLSFNWCATVCGVCAHRFCLRFWVALHAVLCCANLTCAVFFSLCLLLLPNAIYKFENREDLTMRLQQ